MNKFDMKTSDFKAIYRFFGVKLAIFFVRNPLKRIKVVGFDFGSNMTVRS